MNGAADDPATTGPSLADRVADAVRSRQVDTPPSPASPAGQADEQHRYVVEVLSLGRRPLDGVTPQRTSYEDESAAVTAHCTAVGAVVLQDGMSVTAADRRTEVGRDGIMAAAILTHDHEGGRVEVLLRRVPDPASQP